MKLKRRAYRKAFAAGKRAAKRELRRLIDAEPLVPTSVAVNFGDAVEKIEGGRSIEDVPAAAAALAAVYRWLA